MVFTRFPLRIVDWSIYDLVEVLFQIVSSLIRLDAVRNIPKQCSTGWAKRFFLFWPNQHQRPNGIIVEPNSNTNSRGAFIVASRPYVKHLLMTPNCFLIMLCQRRNFLWTFNVCFDLDFLAIDVPHFILGCVF